jgi:ABC-type lipoprotein export system ATPase subunit
MTIVMVTHAADVAAHAHRVIAMRDGRIIDSTHPFDHDRFALAT